MDVSGSKSPMFDMSPNRISAISKHKKKEKEEAKFNKSDNDESQMDDFMIKDYDSSESEQSDERQSSQESVDDFNVKTLT